jgi:hypothetical protein
MNIGGVQGGEVVLITSGNLKLILKVGVKRVRSELDGEKPDDFRYDFFASGTKLLSGDSANPATSIAEMYYSEGLSVSELVPLAAFTIVKARSQNTAGIDGLDIVRCTEQGISFLPDDEIESLAAWATKLDRKIRRQLLHSWRATPQFRTSPKHGH